MNLYQTELEVAVEAAKLAANVIAYHAHSHKEPAFKLKGKHDLVTQADLDSEKIIKKTILKTFPSDLMLAEESHSGSTLTHNRTWIIDPIDGTTNFAHGVPFYAVSIALYVDKLPQVAVVLGLPFHELFTATRGQGAYLNGERLHVSSTNEASSALIGTGFPYRDLSVLEDYMKVFDTLMHETHGVRRPGSASYDMAYVAAGRYDGFYEYALAPWDVAAGALLITEAGGVVSDWTNGDDWLFGARIIAANADIHSYLRTTILKHVRTSLLNSQHVT
jgi:myo-inositol-1(or 4)-monophosphatase